MVDNIIPGWSIVAGGWGGTVNAEPLDCCAYTLKTDEGILLFDAGVGFATSSIFSNVLIAGSGRGPERIFLTHAHPDHSGGAAMFQERFGSKIFAGSMTAERIETEDETALSLDDAKRSGNYPTDYRIQKCWFDGRLEDGDTMQFGGASITAITTPGHSSDHISYLVEYGDRVVLVAGDALFSGGTILLQNTWDCSIQAACASIYKLAERRFDVLLPGHGEPVLTDAFQTVEIALSRIQQLLPPHNFF